MKKVGKYWLGWEQVTLYVDKSRNGFYRFSPRNMICVGLEGPWDKTVARVQHEAFEWVAGRNRCRYNTTEDMGKDVHAYMFVMGHPEFSDCIAKCSEYLVACYKDLHKEWKKNKK